ncbi:hypothetical protein K438DRAFT_1707015 [Mycena galopus ATCC 62051]|nr:hypothetical protein K438DRAFT_1707015 [Mycena galopus ATCC 62051]
MLATTSLVLASFVALASAHFQLQVPLPRGVFVEDSEPTFCDGYDNAVSNRSTFPISGGYFVLNSEHTSWTIGVNVSTSQNPQQFSDFSMPVFPFASESGEGLKCFPIDLSSAGLTDGQNVTMQFVFDGSDGVLYQAGFYCADVTVSTTAVLPADSTCNFTTGVSVSGSATKSGASATAPPSTSPSASASAPPSGAVAIGVPGGYLALLVALAGLAAGAAIV